MEAILNKIEKTETCWNWLGELNEKGYGRVVFCGKKRSAHRFLYELLKKKVSLGLEIDHLCRNRKCVNPNHLEEVTHKENMKRAWAVRIKDTPNCPKGHPYDKNNLYMIVERKTGKTWRSCRECRKLNIREYRKLNPKYGR